MQRAIGMDRYNQTITGNTAPTLRSSALYDGIPHVITITMNTYQVVEEDIISSLLASDCRRGGGVAIVVPKTDRIPDGIRIQQTWNTGSNE